MINTLLKSIEAVPLEASRDCLPRSFAARTRRIYDLLAGFYPLSTYLFHSSAHRCAVEVAGVRDGMRVLEVATGSGEMFRRLVRVNRQGKTLGLDISPNMAARTLRHVRAKFPDSWTACQAVDARFLPFRSSSFDVAFCCYLFELLGGDDIMRALEEIHRVLRPGGSLAVVCIGQNAEFFNRLYRVAGSIAPAFWGRQIEERLPVWIEASDFRIVRERHIRQNGYPSRVLLARK